MKRRLEFLWARAGSIQVVDMTNDFFLLRFSNEDDYNVAAFWGPWKIYDYYIAVSQWSPTFNEEEKIRSILTWVRLPKLPIHYFNTVVVSRIGNFIGRTVRLDLATKEGSRCRYARVCVEIDLTKPLLGKYMTVVAMAIKKNPALSCFLNILLKRLSWNLLSMCRRWRSLTPENG
ncbi:hypothetical protein LINPERPRIM_LOCUS29861 [Linum perenne]